MKEHSVQRKVIRFVMNNLESHFSFLPASPELAFF